MNLAEEFISFDNEKKRIVHFELCLNALEILNEYFSATVKIEYVETVVGTKQTVDKKLPAMRFSQPKMERICINRKKDLSNQLSLCRMKIFLFPKI